MEKKKSCLLYKKINYRIKLHFMILYIILIISIVINIILNNNIIIGKKTRIVKTMDESTQIADKEKTIDDLNESKTEYSNYINTSKIKIASALTDMGVTTSSQETLETMASNIRSISISGEISAFETYGITIIHNASYTASYELLKNEVLLMHVINSGGGDEYDPVPTFTTTSTNDLTELYHKRYYNNGDTGYPAHFYALKANNDTTINIKNSKTGHVHWIFWKLSF